MKSIFLIITFIVIYCTGYSQSTDESVDNDSGFKNALVFTVGTSGFEIPFIPSFQYERTLIQGKKKKRFVFGINTGYTRYKTYKENIYHLRIYMLIGRYASKFEFSIGTIYQQYVGSNTVYESEFGGAISYGYRYQKETSRFLFRAGLGSPEAVYMGIGFRF